MKMKEKETLDEDTKKMEEAIQPTEMKELQEVLGPEKEILK